MYEHLYLHSILNFNSIVVICRVHTIIISDLTTVLALHEKCKTFSTGQLDICHFLINLNKEELFCMADLILSVASFLVSLGWLFMG